MTTKKKIMIGAGVILLLVAVWYFFLKKPSLSYAGMSAAMEKRVKEIEAQIKNNDPNWLAIVTAEATKNGTTVDEEIHKAAIWFVKTTEHLS